MHAEDILRPPEAGRKLEGTGSKGGSPSESFGEHAARRLLL
jgi:hypothetical protein